MNELIVKVSDKKGKLVGFVNDQDDLFPTRICITPSVALRFDKRDANIIKTHFQMHKKYVAEIITETEMYSITKER